jgi:hypothetical protein
MEYVMANEFGNLGTLSPEDYAQQQQITRQQRLAEMLMSQNQQPQGQMISGRYVAPSFFQNILPLVNLYQGQRLAEKADTKAAQLAEAIRGRNATELQDILNKQFGSADYKPAVTPEIKRDDMGNVMPNIENQVGVAPNKQAAFMAASQARGPQAQALFQTLLANKLAPKVHTVAQGGALVQENDQGGITPLYQNPKEPDHPASYKEFLLAQKEGFKGTYNDYQTMDANRKRPVTNVSVPVSVTTQKAYGQEFGGLIAKQDMDKYTVAQAAPKILQQSLQIKDLLSKGAFTGTGADFALNAAKVFNVAGANNADKIKNTELLVSSLGQNVLNNIKTSGLGAGQGFTDKDRQFLERVVGGQIALDKTTLTELANLQERAAKASLSQWNDRFKTMPKEVIQATGIAPVYMPMNTNPNNVFSAADAIIGK